MAIAYRDTPVGFHRVLKGPLDDREIFKSNIDLLRYCNSETAYNGQRVVVSYGYYDQECTIKAGEGNILVPIIDMHGSELITIKVNQDIYALVLHYTSGGEAYTDKSDLILKLNDPYYYAILPMAGLLANNDEAISFMLEVNDEEPQFFVQPNPVLTESDAQTKSVYDRAVENMGTDNVVRLWVKCNEYFKAMGVR